MQHEPSERLFEASHARRPAGRTKNSIDETLDSKHCGGEIVRMPWISTLPSARLCVELQLFEPRQKGLQGGINSPPS